VQKYISYIVLVAFIIIFQGHVFGQNAKVMSGATLVFDEEKYDFGEVGNDSVLTHVFKFENTGTDTLFIKGVRGS
jgi:hypothetical protein